MDRRQRIKFTLERIKLSKKLVTQQLELIRLGRAIGFEPVHAPANLERYRTQFSEQRLTLIGLTRRVQKDFARRRPVGYLRKGNSATSSHGGHHFVITVIQPDAGVTAVPHC
jgi:hypothetical protein